MKIFVSWDMFLAICFCKKKCHKYFFLFWDSQAYMGYTTYAQSALWLTTVSLELASFYFVFMFTFSSLHLYLNQRVEICRILSIQFYCFLTCFYFLLTNAVNEIPLYEYKFSSLKTSFPYSLDDMLIFDVHLLIYLLYIHIYFD